MWQTKTQLMLHNLRHYVHKKSTASSHSMKFFESLWKGIKLGL
jgi:hypothetical protein